MLKKCQRVALAGPRYACARLDRGSEPAKRGAHGGGGALGKVPEAERRGESRIRDRPFHRIGAQAAVRPQPCCEKNQRLEVHSLPVVAAHAAARAKLGPQAPSHVEGERVHLAAESGHVPRLGCRKSHLSPCVLIGFGGTEMKQPGRAASLRKRPVAGPYRNELCGPYGLECTAPSTLPYIVPRAMRPNNERKTRTKVRAHVSM